MMNFFSPISRPLTADDTTAYRALRQRILHSEDARFFSDSFEREARLTEDEWLRWCEETKEHCILGTFDGQKLIGIIMITQQGPIDSPVVEWEAAWLDPKYRREGIGKLFYTRAQAWTQAQGYKYVAGFIRAAYTPAHDICRDLGFVYTYTIPNETWADGSTADTHAYILDLRADAALHAHEPPMLRFKDALRFLSQGPHAPAQQPDVKVA